MKQKILVISSSCNIKGNSSFLASLFVSQANLDLYEFSWINLYDLNIEYLNNQNRTVDVTKNPSSKDVRSLITAIEEHEKIVLAFPIWNSGVPAILKNFLDRAGVSGRAWSDKKQRKIPNWQGKKFYLLFTMGSHWPLSLLSNLAIFQLYFVLKYYGARVRIVQRAHNCGNGSQLVLSGRKGLIKKMHRKAKRYFGK